MPARPGEPAALAGRLSGAWISSCEFPLLPGGSAPPDRRNRVVSHRRTACPACPYPRVGDSGGAFRHSVDPRPDRADRALVRLDRRDQAGLDAAGPGEALAHAEAEWIALDVHPGSDLPRRGVDGHDL